MQALGRLALACGDVLVATAALPWLPRAACTELISLKSFGSRWQTGIAGSAPAAAQALHAPVGSSCQHHAVVLDGRAVAAAWQEELARDVHGICVRGGRPPGLGVVLVGNRPDSLVYVTRKKEACERVGMYADLRRLPASISQPELEGCVRELCQDSRIDGVLVQLPLPPHINEEKIIEAMDPAKDVDGFHPLNMGRTLMRGRTARSIPCTPLGIMQLLERSGVETQDKNVVVMGDSNIVGMPLAMLFRDSGCATVTVIHRTSYRELFTDATCSQRAEQRARAEACLPRIPGPLVGHARGKEPWSQLPPSSHPYEVSYSSQLRDAYGAPAAPGQVAAPTAGAPAAAVGAVQGQASSPSPQLHQDLPAMTRTADILVVAVGYPHLVKRDWVKPGAVVIDVGINVVEEGEEGAEEGAPQRGSHSQGQDSQGAGSGSIEAAGWAEQQQQHVHQAAAGQQQQQNQQHVMQPQTQHDLLMQQQHHPFHVVGDVDFEQVAGVASCITPVPGGVGPMTIAAVLHNTVQAAARNLRLEAS